MPAPRTDGVRPAAMNIQVARVTEAEAQARHRAGNGGSRYVPRQVRNGLPPLRPYVYRGTGYDLFTGEK